MKDDWLGLNHLLSLDAVLQTVRPLSSALSSGHLRIAPPQSSSGIPRCFRYHAASAALSPLLLKKTPPIPVTFAIRASDVFNSQPRDTLTSYPTAETEASDPQRRGWRGDQACCDVPFEGRDCNLGGGIAIQPTNHSGASP